MTDSTTCQNCGATVPGSAAFCTTCGTKVEDSTSSEPTSSEPTGSEPARPLQVSSLAGEDATRIEEPALHETTQVLPEARQGQAQNPEPPPWSAPAPDAQSWSAQTPAPPQQQPWQPPSTAAPQPGGWQPQPTAQPDWSQQQQQGPGGQAWTPPGGPTAPPNQWQQPAPSWQTGPSTTAHPRDDSGSAPLAALLAFLGAILLVISVFTPWIGIKGAGQSTTFSGWQMVTDKKKVDGFQTPDPAILLGIAAAALAVGALLIAGKNKAVMRVLLILAGIGTAVVVVRDWLSIRDTVKKVLTSGFKLTFQYGFWLAVAGAAILLVAAFMPSKKRT